MFCLKIGAGHPLEVSKLKVKCGDESHLRRKLQFIRVSAPERAGEVYAKLPEILSVFEIGLTPSTQFEIEQIRVAHPKAAIMLRVTAAELEALGSAFGADAIVLTTEPNWLVFEYSERRGENAKRLGLESGEFIRLCRQVSPVNASCCASGIILRLAARYGYVRTFVSEMCEREPNLECCCCVE